MVIISTKCENFMFVRLSYVILLTFEKGQFQYSFSPLIKLCLKPKISKTWQSWIFPVFSYVLEQASDVTLSEKKWS